MLKKGPAGMEKENLEEDQLVKAAETHFNDNDREELWPKLYFSSIPYFC